MTREDFIARTASLMAPWGMSRTTARVYAYMLIHADPVDHDMIAADLSISRSAAWNAARELEEFGHVVRSTAPGTKRAFYKQSEDFAAPLKEQIKLLNTLGQLLDAGAGAADVNARSAQIMRQRAQFYTRMGELTAAGISSEPALAAYGSGR